MPVGIAASSLGRIGTGVQPLLVAILLHQGATTFATELHGKRRRIGLVSCMTVDAMAVNSTHLQNGSLVETVQITLIDTDVSATHLITRWNSTISQAIIL